MSRFSQLTFVLVTVAISGCLNVVDSTETKVAPGVPTFDQFLADTYQEPDTGVFIVDGDRPVLDEKLLHAFYDEMVADYTAQMNEEGSSSVKEQGLALATSGGQDITWNTTDRMNLTYCVSRAFGSKQAQVGQAMSEATRDWE